MCVCVCNIFPSVSYNEIGWLVVLGFNATLTAKFISWRSLCLNWGSNSQPPGHESDTLASEPPGRGTKRKKKKKIWKNKTKNVLENAW